MKNTENDENIWPIEVLTEKELLDEITDSRKYADLKEEEIETYCRLYPFTPTKELSNRFGLDEKENANFLQFLKGKGIILRKDKHYVNTTISKTDGTIMMRGGEPAVPGYLIASLENSISEEERRELMLMYEEGIDPIPMMKQLIVVQSARFMRGFKAEISGNHGLYKTTNEAGSDLRLMIKDLHEMEEGTKIVHGIDDSFANLVMENSIDEDDL